MAERAHGIVQFSNGSDLLQSSVRVLGVVLLSVHSNLFSGTVDMAHMLYLDCKAGRHPKTDDFKQTDRRAYQPFTLLVGLQPAPNATDRFAMNHYDPTTQESTQVERHAQLDQFFRRLPRTYYSYVDTRDLGQFSYSYAYDSNLESLFKTMDCVEQDEPLKQRKNRNQRKLTSDNRAEEWRQYLVEQLEDKNLSTSEMEHQLGLVHCILHDERYGLKDYSDEFRKNFNLAADDHAPCIERVQRYREAQRRGQDLVQLKPKWRAKFQEFFPH